MFWSPENLPKQVSRSRVLCVLSGGRPVCSHRELTCCWPAGCCLHSWKIKWFSCSKLSCSQLVHSDKQGVKAAVVGWVNALSQRPHSGQIYVTLGARCRPRGQSTSGLWDCVLVTKWNTFLFALSKINWNFWFNLLKTEVKKVEGHHWYSATWGCKSTPLCVWRPKMSKKVF